MMAENRDLAFGPGWEREHAVDHADYLDALLNSDDPLHEVAVAAGSKDRHSTDGERAMKTYPFDRTLLIREPWASLVIDGHKTWELRRSSTKVRGTVGLTPSGSGVIAGQAELIDVHGPFTAAELKEHRDRHLVDDEFLDAYAAGKPLYAWEFRNARRFDSPIWCDHPKGAVIWVKLT